MKHLTIIFLLIFKLSYSQWTSLGVNGFSDSAINNSIVRLDNNGITYVVIKDATTSLISVKKHNGTSWDDVGESSITTTAIEDMDFEIDSDGVLYIAYNIPSLSYKLKVDKFDGTNWTTVLQDSRYYEVELEIYNNRTLFITGNDTNGYLKGLQYSLATSSVNYFETTNSRGSHISTTLRKGSSQHYVAYRDSNATNRLTVKRVSPNGWDVIKHVGITYTGNTSIGVTSDNKIYVSCSNGTFTTIASYEHSPSIWTQTDSYTYKANFSSLAIIDDVPYVSYSHLDTTTNKYYNKVTKFVNNNWELIGQSVNETSNTKTSLVSNNNKLYTSYTDVNNANKVSVKSYDLDITLSTSKINTNNLAILVINNKIVSNLKNITIRVFSIAGKQVDNSNLNPGVYLVLVNDNKGNIKYFKIHVN